MDVEVPMTDVGDFGPCWDAFVGCSIFSAGHYFFLVEKKINKFSSSLYIGYHLGRE